MFKEDERKRGTPMASVFVAGSGKKVEDISWNEDPDEDEDTDGASTPGGAGNAGKIVPFERLSTFRTGVLKCTSGFSV